MRTRITSLALSGLTSVALVWGASTVAEAATVPDHGAASDTMGAEGAWIDSVLQMAMDAQQGANTKVMYPGRQADSGDDRFAAASQPDASAPDAGTPEAMGPGVGAAAPDVNAATGPADAADPAAMAPDVNTAAGPADASNPQQPAGQAGPRWEAADAGRCRA